MHRFCNILAMTLVVLAATPSLARRKVTPMYSGVLSTQPSAHVPGSSIVWTDSVWIVCDQDSVTQIAKGIDVADSSDGGTVLLHLWEDPDSTWCLIRLDGGIRKGYLFDKIHQPRSVADTMPRKDIIIWH
jgi:hypothetical protein